MSITVKDLLELNSFTSFRLIAGASGLDKPIESAGIADWEFVQGINPEAIRFEKNSLVISSLLFARNEPDQIQKALEYLIRSGASAMAYKDVFIKELPPSVIKLADEHDFPIFVFCQTFFEDILVDVHQAILAADHLKTKKEALWLLLNGALTKTEVQRISRLLCPHVKEHVLAAYFHSTDSFHDGEILRIIKNNNILQKDLYDIAVCGWAGGVLILASADHQDQQKLSEVIKKQFSTTILHKKAITLGMSSLHTRQKLDQAVNEALSACMAARAENRESFTHQQIGAYQFLIPNRDSESLLRFMQDYLHPILQGGRSSEELLDTAIAFVSKDGNFKAVSEALFVHENTLRYRLSKLHKLLSPHSPEFVFYQNLALSIKLYLILHLDK